MMFVCIGCRNLVTDKEWSGMHRCWQLAMREHAVNATAEKLKRADEFGKFAATQLSSNDGRAG